MFYLSWTRANPASHVYTAKPGGVLTARWNNPRAQAGYGARGNPGWRSGKGELELGMVRRLREEGILADTISTDLTSAAGAGQYLTS